MKVGIIGGGLSGLTCAYRLHQAGIESVIFEKEISLGGRSIFGVIIGSKDFYPRVNNLIKELGLEDMRIPLPATSGAFIDGKEIIGFEEIPDILKKLSVPEVAFFQKLAEEVSSFSFNVKYPDPRLVKLRDISFADYIKDCPERIRRLLVEPFMNFTFGVEWPELAADSALFITRFSLDLISGKNFGLEENTLVVLDNILEKKLKDSGIEIQKRAKVNKVERVNSNLKVYFEKEWQEKSEVVDKIVFAVPLYISEKLLSELKLEKESKVKYYATNCQFLKGTLRFERNFFYGIKEKDLTNILGIYAIVPSEHTAFPFNPEEEMDFSVLYKDCQVFEKRNIMGSTVVVPPGAKNPSLKTQIPGVYQCGDFYSYSGTEIAVSTGEMVAELIAREK